MVDIFKKKIQKAINWIAAENKYLKDVEDDLIELKRALSSAKHKEAHKDIKKALRDFWWVERSERRTDKLRREIEGYLKQLEKAMAISQSASTLRERIHKEAEKVLIMTSVYENTLRGPLRKLENQINNEDPLMQIYATIDNILEQIKDVHNWLCALTIDYESVNKLWLEFYTKRPWSPSDAIIANRKPLNEYGIPIPKR